LNFFKVNVMKKCKICNALTHRIEDPKKPLYYHRCETCGFVALDDRFVVDFQTEQKHYEKHNNGFESQGYVAMFEDFIAKAVVPYEDSIKRALDFGCGRGPVLAELLSRRGMEVDKYDLYFYPEKVYKDKQYDLIVSTEVFEHLQDPIKILELFFKHTATNGYIILMTKFPPDEDDVFINWWYRRDITHIAFFTPRSFEIMAEELGLKVLKFIDNNIVIFQKC